MAGRRTTNAVADVRRRLKGLIPACAVAGTTTTTWYRWQRAGTVSSAAAALRLAAHLEPDDPAKQLALARRLAGLT